MRIEEEASFSAIFKGTLYKSSIIFEKNADLMLVK